MESNTAPKSKRLKGFTLLELIIVCALFSMILIGALSVLKPVSLLYKQNVEYESSRATSDIVSTYLEGVLNYADRIWFYENQSAAVYDENVEFQRFLNTYYKGNSAHQTIYMMSIINDPVVAADGTVTEEGYGRIYMREVGTGQTVIDDTLSPRYLAISEGIYEDYGFQIDVLNALPRTLTTTVNVYKKTKNVNPTQITDVNGVSMLVDANGNRRYESNGVEVVKSSNMLNICYYDVDINSPTSIPNYVIVYDTVNGTTTKEPSFYSNPNSASIDGTTPTSNNYYIIFTLPDEAYYINAAENQLEYIECEPKKMEVACGSAKTLDEVLEDNSFKVTAKYTNKNVPVEVSKGILNNGTDGWYVQNSNAYTANINNPGEVVFYVYFESEMTQFTINFKEQPLVNQILVDPIVALNGTIVKESDFSVTVKRGETFETISSASYSVKRTDGSDISTIDTTVPGVYPVTITYTGDGAAAGLTPVQTVVLVPTLSSISVAPGTTAFAVGTVLTDADMPSIAQVVTANYSPLIHEGVTYNIPTQIVTPTSYSYPTGALAEGTYTVTVSYTEGGITATADVPITASASTVSLNVTSASVNNWGSSGQLTIIFNVTAEPDESWVIDLNLGVSISGMWGSITYGGTTAQIVSDKVQITGTGSVSKDLYIIVNTTDSVAKIEEYAANPGLITYTVN